MKTNTLTIAAAALALASCSPTDYVVEREAMIAAPTYLVFEQINNMKNRDAWSPWEAKDPDMTKTYEGPEAGVGAIYKWSGNDSVGTGMMEILESEPNKHVKSKLVFTSPSESDSEIIWDLEETSEGTKAVWKVAGQLPGYQFWMGQDDMEEAMGPDFENGLANLKRVSEMKASELTKPQDLQVEMTEVQSQPYYSIRREMKFDSINSKFFETRYGQLMAYLGDDAKKMIGAPFAIYHKWDETNQLANIEVAIACNSKKAANGEIRKGSTYAGKVMMCKYMGPYEGTGAAHEFMDGTISGKGYEIAGSPWEVYVTDPADEPDPNNWITEIYYPVKEMKKG